MRGFSRMAALVGAAALSVGAFSNPLTSRFGPGPIILGGGSGRERTPQPPRIKGKRPSLATVNARRIGEREDPGFGIASKGRRGARARMLAMEARRKRLRSRTPGTSNPFTKQARKDAFNASFKALTDAGINPDWARRQAMKNARRVAA